MMKTGKDIPVGESVGTSLGMFVGSRVGTSVGWSSQQKKWVVFSVCGPLLLFMLRKERNVSPPKR